jgi:hypothetical protein
MLYGTTDRDRYILSSGILKKVFMTKSFGLVMDGKMLTSKDE